MVERENTGLKFCKWIRHELDDIEFIGNLMMLIITDGSWFIIMLLYYWIFKRRER